MTDTRPCFHQWLDDHRRASTERGGKALRFVPKGAPRGNPDRDPHYWNGQHPQRATADRKPGEIINPKTGEVVTGCLTVAKFAETVAMSTRTLIGHLKTLGLLHDVLDWKAVPMVQAPDLAKPEYSHRAGLAPWALESGYGVTIATGANSARSGRGMQVKCDLLTPEGQRFVVEQLEAEAAQRTPPKAKTLDRVREIIEREPMVSNREIARCLGVARQAVQRVRRRLAA